MNKFIKTVFLLLWIVGGIGIFLLMKVIMPPKQDNIIMINIVVLLIWTVIVLFSFMRCSLAVLDDWNLIRTYKKAPSETIGAKKI